MSGALFQNRRRCDLCPTQAHVGAPYAKAGKFFLCLHCSEIHRHELDRMCYDRDHRGFGTALCEDPECAVRKVMQS